jgi:predicted O-methyltransferase YrrM
MNNKYGRELLRILLNNSLLRVVLYSFYFMRFGFYVIKERSFLFLRYYPGYHGSTIPSMKFILNNCDSIFVDSIDEPDGIQMNEGVQISLAEDFMAHYGDFSPPAEKSSDCLYFYKNNMFGFNDGFALYSFIRKYCPKRIVEIGSGFSSALMIDTCDKFNHNAELTFVDPWSINVLDVIKSNKSNLTVNYLRKEIQLIDLSLFGSLDANDIVFIDTSHALKIGSDLSFIFYKILPLLRIGVIVHIHDIWYPFEYPRSMVLEGRIYNEAYFVRSFLQFNKSFEILFFGSFLELRHKNIFDQMPGYFKDSGKSLWLRRNA